MQKSLISSLKFPIHDFTNSSQQVDVTFMSDFVEFVSTIGAWSISCDSLSSSVFQVASSEIDLKSDIYQKRIGEIILVFGSGVIKIEDMSRVTDKNEYYMFSVSITSFDPKIVDELVHLISRHSLDEKINFNPGHAYVMTSGMSGIGVTPIGLAGSDLIEENYMPDVVSSFKRAVEDMRSDEPSGRLIILEGPPGTGKTHLIRAFMGSILESKFLIIPPGNAKSLMNPDMIPALINQMDGTGPLVIVLEDAERCLEKREDSAENLEGISALLNLSDGIIGSMIDVRIIASTNISSQEFDSAILRPGRMSEHIKVGPLDIDRATAAWMKMTGDASSVDELDDFFMVNDHISLADLYKRAKATKKISE
jgi:ATP-dependent Zn protease